MRSVLAVLVAVLAALPHQAQAGGPAVFNDSGRIMKWPLTSGPVTMRLDQGGLGRLSKTEADDLVARARDVWTAVPESAVALGLDATQLADDVTSANYETFLGWFTLNGFNPIIYDADGGIIEDLFGAGASNRMLGFTDLVYREEPATTAVLEVRIVLNGRFLDGISSGGLNREVTAPEFHGVLVHELGHALGLDHAQINAMDPDNTNQPTMFPLFYGGEAMGSLGQDDIGWIAHLYPDEAAGALGAISGEVRLTTPTGTRGYQGLNVLARRIDGTAAQAGSCVSGYLFRAGKGPLSLAGTYLIPGLPPGEYRVEVEEVLDVFIGASSVGPLDPPEDFPEPAGPEAYNGPWESADDRPEDITPVEVVAGRETEEIDIVLNTGGAVSLRAPQWSLYR